MRAALPIKVFSLVVLSVVTALLTSTLLDQGHHASGGTQPATQGEPVVDVPRPIITEFYLPVTKDIGGRVEPPIAAPDNFQGEEPLAVFLLTDFNVSVWGRDVFVSATSDLRDKRPDILYFWSLRVTDGANRDVVFWRHHYLDQIFAIPDEQEMSPTFDEWLQLGPGDYRVELSLFQVPPGADLPKADDDEWAQGHHVIRTTHRITVMN